MTPGAIAIAKQVLADVKSDEMRALARRILRLPTVDEIEHELLAALGRLIIEGGAPRPGRGQESRTEIA